MVTKSRPRSWLQLRVELVDLLPRVWRRIRAPDTITLVQLHRVTQIVMGWDDVHLHEFIIGGRRYGSLDPEWDDPDLISEARRRLLKVLGDQTRFTYLYDFGDGWRHQFTLEQVLAMERPLRQAVCVAGENACPPEDVGGPSGYYDFLEAILNPGHKEHPAMLRWHGGPFDPGRCDIASVNEALSRVRL